MSFTRDLAARAVALSFADLPTEVVAMAKSTLLDTVSVALAAVEERVVTAVRELVSLDGGNGVCTLWGRNERASACQAAFVNGTAAHALDFDDVCWAMNAHPSAVLWPTTLAVAESIGASGKDALVGYVAGFEAEADIGAFLGRAHYEAGWHPTSTIGVIGATVAAGKILRMDERTLARAVGIACSEAAGTRMNFGTDAKPLHAGLAARGGVTAALLAAKGVTAREDALEGAMGFKTLYAGQGERTRRSGFALLDPGVELKPYPSCRFTHRVIDAVLELRKRNGDRALASLRAVVDPFAEKIVIYPRPKTGLEAKFSMEYCAAVTWLDGVPPLAAFTDERASKQDVQRLLRNVTVEAGGPDFETVIATFTDGSTETETVRVARGSPARPLTGVELRSKTVLLCSRVLGEKTHLLEHALDALEQRENVCTLHDVLVP